MGQEWGIQRPSANYKSHDSTGNWYQGSAPDFIPLVFPHFLPPASQKIECLVHFFEEGGVARDREGGASCGQGCGLNKRGGAIRKHAGGQLFFFLTRLKDYTLLQTRLDANLSALQNEMFTLQAEGMDVNSQNGALLAEMAQWREQVTGLEGRLAGAVDARDAAEAEKEACNARQDALQESLQSYLAEIASLQRRLQGRSSPSSSSRRRCPPFRYLFWGLVTLCALFPLEGLSFLL
uniref:Coiled-coil domain-containing protein 194 isoform X2 n=1 Tax=Pogona vitticeps TaxID=103695 RepID=A0ABM5ELA3_9SAUR